MTEKACRLEGCERTAYYRKLGICQMHYFRKMRNGNYELKGRIIKKRKMTPNGYVRIYCKGHPLAINNQVFEHRKVMFDVYGKDLPPCRLCGKFITWGDCHIDHIDENRENNEPDNLRPVCRPCNTLRGRKPEREYDGCVHTITFDGETKSCGEWAKDARINVSAGCIRARKRRGASDYDCLFLKTNA